jgi:hypothetical protein
MIVDRYCVVQLLVIVWLIWVSKFKQLISKGHWSELITCKPKKINMWETIKEQPASALDQSRLTNKFFANELPKMKLQLVTMSILSIILSPRLGYHTHLPLEDCILINQPQTRNVPYGTLPCVQCWNMCHDGPHGRALTRTRPCYREGWLWYQM